MDKEKTVLVAGTFDILHESHVNMLRNAKNLGSKLIVMQIGRASCRERV